MVLSRESDSEHLPSLMVRSATRVTLSYVCSYCHRFPIEDYIWWVSTRHGEMQVNWWCAACDTLYNWRNPNRALVLQDSADPSKVKVFRALRRRVHARISCALSRFWRISRRVVTVLWRSWYAVCNVLGCQVFWPTLSVVPAPRKRNGSSDTCV